MNRLHRLNPAREIMAMPATATEQNRNASKSAPNMLQITYWSSPENRAWDGDLRGANLANTPMTTMKNRSQAWIRTSKVAGLSIGTSGQRNDAVVLRKG